MELILSGWLNKNNNLSPLSRRWQAACWTSWYEWQGGGGWGVKWRVISVLTAVNIMFVGLFDAGAGAEGVSDGLWPSDEDVGARSLRLAALASHRAQSHRRQGYPISFAFASGKYQNISWVWSHRNCLVHTPRVLHLVVLSRRFILVSCILKTFQCISALLSLEWIGFNVAVLLSLQLGATLKKLFLAAQTIAVGMEQVILDRAVYGGDFLEEFANMENNLGMVNPKTRRHVVNIHIKLNDCDDGTGSVLAANGFDGEAGATGQWCSAAAHVQRVSGHEEFVGEESSGFHHHEGVHQPARVPLPGAAALLRLLSLPRLQLNNSPSITASSRSIQPELIHSRQTSLFLWCFVVVVVSSGRFRPGLEKGKRWWSGPCFEGKIERAFFYLRMCR